jgi:hypothetical protein
VSAPGAAAFAGVGFPAALEEELGVPVSADCGEDAGLVMAAIRAGLKEILFTGEERLRAPLAEMAEAAGGRLRHLPGRAVVPAPGEDPSARLPAPPIPAPLSARGLVGRGRAVRLAPVRTRGAESRGSLRCA